MRIVKLIFFSYEKDQVMHVPLGLEHPSSDVETGFREMCVGEKRLLTVPHHGQGDRDLPLQNGHYQYIYIKSFILLIVSAFIWKNNKFFKEFWKFGAGTSILWLYFRNINEGYKWNNFKKIALNSLFMTKNCVNASAEDIISNRNHVFD